MSEAESRPNSTRRNLKLAIAVLASAAVVVAGYWFLFMRGVIFSDDAHFDAEVVNIAPQLSGEIFQIMVQEGDRVEQGQALFTLDDRLLEQESAQAQAELELAQANLSSAQANLDKSLHGPRAKDIRIAGAEADAQRANLARAESNLRRVENLFEENFASQDDLERVQTAYETQKLAYQAALDRLKLLQEGTRSEDISIARAQVQAATAAVARAQANLTRIQINHDHAQIRAPRAAFVVRRWLDEGAMCSPTVPVLTLYYPDTLYIAANIKEQDLHGVNIGAPVDIAVDSFPGLTLHGRVVSIVRAAQSIFSLIPSEGVSGTFVKVTQRVPVRIALDSFPEVPVGPGLSVEVKIRSGQGSDAPLQAARHD